MFAAISIGCNSPVETGAVGGDLLPLVDGNTWSYERRYFVRGLENDVDTLTVTVQPEITYLGNSNVYPVLLQSRHSFQTLYLKRISAEHVVRIEEDSSETSVIGIGRDAAAEFLPTILGGPDYFRYYGSASDSSAIVKSRDRDSKRIIQSGELRYNGRKLLTLQFEHAFIPGIGQVYARYIADLAECQACVLTTEFRTYRLIDFALHTVLY